LVQKSYRFVVYMPDLRCQSRRYQHLGRLHGDAVPVFLSNVDLAVGYYLNPDVDISHMLWGGWSLNKVGLGGSSGHGGTARHVSFFYQAQWRSLGESSGVGVVPLDLVIKGALPGLCASFQPRCACLLGPPTAGLFSQFRESTHSC